MVALMRHYAMHQDCQVEGSKPIEGADQACQLKRIAIFTILDSLCTMIKEKDEEAFHCLYWVLKTFGQIAMDFKDLIMARKVFTKLKYECQDRIQFEHKMITYKQLGYIYRNLKDYQKAVSCFRKYLQLAWFNEDLGAELEAYENLSIDYFYIGLMEKAVFYDKKFQEGIFEKPDSDVRKMAVGMIKNMIVNFKAGRPNGRYVEGKFIKTTFERMPSPSTFGGSLRTKQNIQEQFEDIVPVIDQINKEDFKDAERSEKPYADFKYPELQHMNEPVFRDYLPQPRRTKYDRKLRDTTKLNKDTSVFKKRTLGPSEPYYEGYL